MSDTEEKLREHAQEHNEASTSHAKCVVDLIVKLATEKYGTELLVQLYSRRMAEDT